MDFEISVLPNGLRILTANMPSLESASVGFFVNTGSADENLEINGISHFLEHMAFKGTKTRTAKQISEEIESFGGSMNAYTSRETTAFYAKVLKEHIPLAVDILSDILLNSTFPDEEIKKEQDVVVQEIRRSADDPDDVIFDLFQNTLFNDQPLGRDILGTQERVLSFNKKDLQNYMLEHYCAQNIVACACGKVNHAQFVELVKQKWEGFRSQSTAKRPLAHYTGGLMLKEKDTEQSRIILGFPSANDFEEERFMPIETLSYILGGGSSSRLFQEVREKRGLAYSVYCFSRAYNSAGSFAIYAGTSHEKVKQMTEVICTELHKICTQSVSDKELNKAKNQLKADILMAFESTGATSRFLASQLLTHSRVKTTQELIDKIQSVTKEQVQNEAKKIFYGKPTYVLLGDTKEYMQIEEIEKIIKQ